MQRDLARGQKSEINDLLFHLIALAEEAGLSVPVYRKVAGKFKQ
jgi:ketopantoate reductase